MNFVVAWGEIGIFPFDPVSATGIQVDLDYYIKHHVDKTRGLIIATTLAETQQVAGEVLKDRGFKETLRFRGRAVEGSAEIILWTKVLNEV